MKKCPNETALTHLATLTVGAYAALGIKTLSSRRRKELEAHCAKCPSCKTRLAAKQTQAEQSAHGLMSVIAKERQPSLSNLIPTRKQLERRRASSR